MPPDNHNKISEHNFLAEVKQENCKWDFHPSKWKCHCNNNAREMRKLCNFFNSSQKNNLYNCRKKEEEEKKNILRLVLSFIVFWFALSLCRWQSASVFDNVPNGENQIECKNGKLLKSRVQLSVKWVCQPQYEVPKGGKESHREREREERAHGVVVKPTGACWSASLLFFLLPN